MAFFQPGISVSGLEILPYENFSPVTRMKVGWIVVARMASSCIACSIFRIISIPFNCSAWYSFKSCIAKAMIGAKVVIFVFRNVCFVSRISRQNSSPVSLWEHSIFFGSSFQFPTVSSALSQLVNRAEISYLDPRRNWSRYGMPLWKWTYELVTDLFQELFHYLWWSLMLNRLQFYFDCLMLRLSSGHVKTTIWGTDEYQIFQGQHLLPYAKLTLTD